MSRRARGSLNNPDQNAVKNSMPQDPAQTILLGEQGPRLALIRQKLILSQIMKEPTAVYTLSRIVVGPKCNEEKRRLR